MFMGISPLCILVLLCFSFLHNPSLTFATNFPAPYSCFPVDTNPVHYRCFDNNLPSHNPAFSLPHTPSYSPPKPLKWALAFGRVNTIATLLIVLITLLNVIVYKLRQLQELNSGEKLTVSSSLPSEPLCRRFSLSEILSATHNFDESLVIGQGGFGKVYKGVVDSGASTVAVKRLNPLSKQGAGEFWTEISMLSKYRHSHLVCLLGYCDNYSEMILVYEYMVHGTLADHLHKLVKNGASNTPLCWVERLKICIGAARGLDYLHTGTGIRHRVIHRDVKSTNILLDENWAAKISDFGMSKIGPANQSCTHISASHVKGTFGYVDPEYFLTRKLTRKSDVYSFGVVLLEVLCGRPAVDSRLHEDQRGLARWAQHCIKEGKVDQIVDSTIKGQILSNCLSAFVQIADQCLDILPKKRPTMAEVVAWLEFALSLQQKRDSSILEEGYTFMVSESQENAGSSTNREIISDNNGEDDGIIVLGDGNGVESPIKPTVNGANGAESPVKPISVGDYKNGSRSLTNPVKRMTFTKKVQSLFVKPRRVLSEKIKGMGNCCRKTKNDLPSTTHSSSQGRSDPKPSSDAKSKNNLGGTSVLPDKNEDIVQLVPPSRYLVTPNPVQDARATKAQNGRKNNGRNSTLANKDEVFVSQVPPSGQIVAEKLKMFTYAELKIATSNFRPNTLLGEGGFGKVFKGWVNEKTYAPTKPNVGMPIAVKKYNPEGFQGFKEWQSEVEFLGRYIHPNLVMLLGYCWEDKEVLIVYEYMSNGSLENHIFRRSVEPLSWATRLKIAAGAARGLAFLHTAETQVIYRDFKCSNILLDEDFNPKLSDFGLAKSAPGGDYSHVSTRILGTYGYAAPEYVATGHLTVKSDVYGFGVVLLELLTGLRALDVNRPAGQHSLVAFAEPLLRNKRKLKSLVDPRLELNYPPKGAFRLAALSLCCLEVNPKARPQMTEVVETLEQIRQLTEGKIL